MQHFETKQNHDNDILYQQIQNYFIKITYSFIFDLY